MLKKPYIVGGGLALAVVVLVLAFTGGPVTAATYSKADRATQLWKMSGHADKAGMPFNDWNDAGSIPTTCAKCHSRYGIIDYMGYDGSNPNTVDMTAKIGTTVDCLVCHVDDKSGILRSWNTVVFPSGAVVGNLGPEALCMECHQGRASTTTIDTKIASSGVTDPDVASSKLTFSNIHYFAAAATQMGTRAKGGYEYAGKEYDARFSHIAGYNSCTTCHNPHSLQVNIKGCNTCHTGISDPKDIRFVGSQTDYDGDGDIEEGMYYEIQHIMDRALAAIYRYARTVLNKPIVYNADVNPYWFVDNNGNGIADADDTTSYTAFSIRLLKAAYNYQVAKKDPNNFAHNGKYVIELLYDSLEDMNQKLDVPTDLSAMHREDEGHFNGGSMPFRDWDDSADYTVSSSCSKCHSATGLAKYLAGGQQALTANEPVANGFLCTTCHTVPPKLIDSPPVLFLSGVYVNLSTDGSNLCLVCHQGRASKSTVDSTIAASKTGVFSVSNIHYYPEAAMFLGTEVQGGYEFPGKSYARRQDYPNHGGMFNTCVQCHMSSAVTEQDHAWTLRRHNIAEPMKENCAPCHGQDVSQTFKGRDPEKFDFEQIRPGNIPDYDADGNTRESLSDEIHGLEALLANQIRAYVQATAGVAIVFDSGYFYKDLNGNGILEPNENTSGNRYSGNATWLKAAYNLRTSTLAEHGFIHNARYVAQLLVDSYQSVGGNIAAFTWR
jgi:hypothetical protein